MAKAIDKIGVIVREADSDIFSSVIHHIIAQQISTKAQDSIWRRFCERFVPLNAHTIARAQVDELRKCGISERKAQYILDFAFKVQNGEFDLEALAQKSDEDAITELTKLKGIGIWTAEMILLFCMQRRDIFSFNDLALQRGLKTLYKLTTLDKNRFESYRKKFSPHCSIASLYIWEISSGKYEI